MAYPMTAAPLAEFPQTGDCLVVPQLFLDLCGEDNFIAALLLAELSRWTVWIVNYHPIRDGWFFKTFNQLKKRLKISRWQLEQARRFLVDQGLIEYRRAGWCGVMHWRVLDTLLVKLDEMKRSDDNKTEEVPPTEPRKANKKLTAVKLPSWVDAELFEAHLQHCYRHHKSTNKDAQRGKLKQLEMARKKGIDPQLIQANAVGGGWLNFYAPNIQGTIPDEPSPEENYRQQLADRMADDEQIRNSSSSEEALPILAGMMDKLRRKMRVPDSG